MEHPTKTHTKNTNIDNNNANNLSHYKLIVVGLIIGLAGIFLRFAGSWTYIDTISNILFAIGSVICIKAVLDILK
jgi:hypothetical protein